MKRYKILKRLACLTVLTFINLIVFGQDSLLNSDNNAPPEPVDSNTKTIIPLTRLEFQLSIIVLIFGVLIILFEIFLIRSKKIGSEDSVKFVTITLIIISTLFLITAGYSNDQIAPAVGLLGTIAGYLLGRISNPKNDKDEIHP
jgi:hypothetical protein